MLPTVESGGVNYTVDPFNSFWDATSKGEGASPGVVALFQFLLGCYPLVKRAEEIKKERTFNSFWDATTGEGSNGERENRRFQFLLGCYAVDCEGS